MLSDIGKPPRNFTDLDTYIYIYSPTHYIYLYTCVYFTVLDTCRRGWEESHQAREIADCLVTRPPLQRANCVYKKNIYDIMGKRGVERSLLRRFAAWSEYRRGSLTRWKGAETLEIPLKGKNIWPWRRGCDDFPAQTHDTPSLPDVRSHTVYFLNPADPSDGSSCHVAFFTPSYMIMFLVIIVLAIATEVIQQHC